MKLGSVSFGVEMRADVRADWNPAESHFAIVVDPELVRVVLVVTGCEQPTEFSLCRFVF